MKGLEFALGESFSDDLRVLEEFLSFCEVDFVLIPDNPLGRPHTSSIVGAKMIADALGIKTIATLSGGGKSQSSILSLLMGAKYARLAGIACVGGDLASEMSGVEVLGLSQGVEFEFKICTTSSLEEKAKLGATHAISQPIFDACFLPQPSLVRVLPNLMPIFSHRSFDLIKQNQAILGFEIPDSYLKNTDLLETNRRLLHAFEDFYLTPINLKKQMRFFREMYAP